ncbi:MAG: nuclear transport factor 2 family protein [Vicinamibacterales bacterium]
MAGAYEFEPVGPAGLSRDDREQIKQLGEERWTRALEAGDFDTVCGLCTDDVVYMPADHPALRGRDQFRRWLEAFPRIVRMTQPMTWIDGQGDMAMAEATFTVTLEVEGRTVESAGKAMCGLRRQAGEWRVKSVCWNFDQPMGPPPPAAA